LHLNLNLIQKDDFLTPKRKPFKAFSRKACLDNPNLRIKDLVDPVKKQRLHLRDKDVYGVKEECFSDKEKRKDNSTF